jgi:hypothetical protein
MMLILAAPTTRTTTACGTLLTGMAGLDRRAVLRPTRGLNRMRNHRRLRATESADVSKPDRVTRPMAKRPTADMIAEGLTVPERVLLFCIASAADWQKAGITHATAQQMMIRGLIDRHPAGSFTLTEQVSFPRIISARNGDAIRTESPSLSRTR